MERTDSIGIYSSRKKSVLLLIGSVLFVAAGVYLFLNAEDMALKRSIFKNPLFVKAAGAAAVLFFGLGIYASIRALIRNRLILTIDNEGIDVNPEKRPSVKIAWKQITGISEVSIHGTRIIVIQVNNPEDWIDRESSAVRRKMMRFNVDYCGSPFNISANATQSSHAELMGILNDSLSKHRN